MERYSKLLPGMVEWTLQKRAEDNVSESFGCGYLFVDVCDFTKLTESASVKGHYGVEIITDILNQYFDLLNEKIMQYNGQIIKSDNDGDDMEYIDITLPGLSFVIYNSEPYTQLELEEIAVLKRAAIAKKEAMREKPP